MPPAPVSAKSCPFRAVLLDRDGVLNDNPNGYVFTWERFVFLPGVLEALARLHAAGILAAVVTNQACIGRGLTTREALDEVHRRMVETVASHGGRLQGVFMCPHAPTEGCACRKPLPGNLLRALTELDVAPEEACYVGDRGTDLLTAQAAGVRGYLVRSGAPFDDLEMLSPPYSAAAIFADLREFVDAVLTTRRHNRGNPYPRPVP